MLLRSKEYHRAAGVLNQIVEKYPTHPTAFPDALFLLGETYYESKQYLSARRIYRQVIERGQERGFASYQGKALARLIDVALRTQDYATLDDVFSRINQLPPSSVEGELTTREPRGSSPRRTTRARERRSVRSRRRVSTITRRATCWASLR